MVAELCSSSRIRDSLQQSNGYAACYTVKRHRNSCGNVFPAMAVSQEIMDDVQKEISGQRVTFEEMIGRTATFVDGMDATHEEKYLTAEAFKVVFGMAKP